MGNMEKVYVCHTCFNILTRPSEGIGVVGISIGIPLFCRLIRAAADIATGTHCVSIHGNLDC
jgi:hypothetical protein